VAGVLCAAGLAYSGRASAEPTAPIELRWHPLEGCPSAESVLAGVYKIAGTTRAAPNTLKADATITQSSDRLFRLRLEIQSGNLAAVRNIDGKSCKDLAGAAAVALALLLSSEEPLSERDLAGTSPTAAGATASGANRGPDGPVAPPKPPPTSPRAAESATTPRPSADAGPPRPWRVLLVAPLGALSFGPMERISRGLGLAAGFSFERWQFLAEGKLWASQRETANDLGGEYEVGFDRFTVGARGCRAVVGSVFEFAPCVVTSVHHLTVRGGGPNLVPGTDAVTWASVGLGAQARLLIAPWLALVGAVDGELQLSRPEVSVSVPPAPPTGPTMGSSLSSAQTADPVQRLAPVAATISIGSQWIF